MRKDFEMTQEDLASLMEASKPVPYMVFGGNEPRSPQENANDAWKQLGDRMGFDHMTVRPNGRGDRFFSAEEKPSPMPDPHGIGAAVERNAEYWRTHSGRDEVATS